MMKKKLCKQIKTKNRATKKTSEIIGQLKDFIDCAGLEAIISKGGV